MSQTFVVPPPNMDTPQLPADSTTQTPLEEKALPVYDSVNSDDGPTNSDDGPPPLPVEPTDQTLNSSSVITPSDVAQWVCDITGISNRQSLPILRKLASQQFNIPNASTMTRRNLCVAIKKHVTNAGLKVVDKKEWFRVPLNPEQFQIMYDLFAAYVKTLMRAPKSKALFQKLDNFYTNAKLTGAKYRKYYRATRLIQEDMEANVLQVLVEKRVAPANGETHDILTFEDWNEAFGVLRFFENQVNSQSDYMYNDVLHFLTKQGRKELRQTMAQECQAGFNDEQNPWWNTEDGPEALQRQQAYFQMACDNRPKRNLLGRIIRR